MPASHCYIHQDMAFFFFLSAFPMFVPSLAWQMHIVFQCNDDGCNNKAFFLHLATR